MIVSPISVSKPLEVLVIITASEQGLKDPDEMKLIVSGGSGFVASEVIRQSLLTTSITSLVVISRRPITVPSAGDGSKLKHVIVKDYDTYPDDIKAQFAGADACIWTVAIRPLKSTTYKFDEIRRVCQTCTMAGLRAITDAGPSQPFRFVYMSGDDANEEDVGKGHFMSDYGKLRFETDQMVREFLHKLPGRNEACVARSGLVTSQANIARSITSTLIRWTNFVPHLRLEEVAAAMLHGVLHGFEAETLRSADLQRIGQKALRNGIEAPPQDRSEVQKDDDAQGVDEPST